MKYTKTLLILVSLILAAGLLFTADSYAGPEDYLSREGSSRALRIPERVTREARQDRYRELMSESAESLEYNTSNIVDLQNEIDELETTGGIMGVSSNCIEVEAEAVAEIMVEDDTSTDADTTGVSGEAPDNDTKDDKDDYRRLEMIN